MKLLLVPIFVVLLDQITKISVKNYFIENNLFYTRINFFGDSFRLVFVENPGIAFGIDTSSFHLYITIFTFLAIIFILHQLIYCINTNSYEKLSLSFILGGAIGNFIDRFLVLLPSFNYNGVIDFIDIGIGGFRWYTFNLADASISIGLVIYLYQTYFSKRVN